MKNAVNILKQYFIGGEKIAVAVSGGSDSMALVHLVLNCGIYDRNNVSVININHNIRGKNSEADSEFVRKFCLAQGVEFIGKSVDIPARCLLNGTGIELEAREARREIFYELIKSGIGKVLLAHHAGDNAETVLMHIFRGCGISGLKGMNICSSDGIFRPMLNTCKQDIIEYLTQNDIAYVTDETNADETYDRNFLRTSVMPLIKQRYPGCEHAINRLCRTAETVSVNINKIIDFNNLDVSEKSSGIVKLKVTALSESALSGEYIFAALKQLGVMSDIFYKHIDLICEMSSWQNGSKLCVGQNITAVKEYDFITFIKDNFASENAEISEPLIFQNVPFNSKTVMKLGESSIIIKKVDYAAAQKVIEYNRQVISAAKNTQIKQKQLQKIKILADLDKIPSTAILRYRRDGDEFSPLGGGTKKLKKYLIDEKIPLRLRDNLICLCDGYTVLAVLGIKVSKLVAYDKGKGTPVIIDDFCGGEKHD